jgi:transcriptional regulator with GAF, ATPase, and Fis domain
MFAGSQIDQARTFAGLSASVQAYDEPDAAAHEAVDQIARLLPGTSNSIMVLRRGRLRPAAATAESLSAVDLAQSTLREGPAVDTTAGGPTAVLADDLTARSPWPRWAPIAVGNGWHTVLTTRLTNRSEHPLGVLTVAHRRPQALDPRQARIAALLAAHLSVALDTVAVRHNLVRAMATNSEIGAAVGMLMERFGIDERQGFLVLRRYSQDLQLKLHDVATQVVDSGRLPRTVRSGGC